jgi:curli biogenesis system outer membrane secretion channel CsgG
MSQRTSVATRAAQPLTLIALMFLPCALPAQEKKDAPRLTVAMRDFSTTEEELKDKGGEAAALLTTLLTASENLVLVERAELAKVLAESEISLSGTVTADSSAKVGRLTEAKILVTCRTFTAGDQHYVVTKVISTETGRVFGQTANYQGGEGCGGTLLANSEVADVVIIGEAFSETVGRRGSLVSCRARFEIKIATKAAKDQIKVDRQTAVAVDLADNVAGKSALQSAGGQLGERLASALAK